ncbi:hypothetical protein NFI96_003592 [Prochilodus magdalenae]|nr:hypothetical protein NFI96_003592 [Prochilodus magdalenae]
MMVAMVEMAVDSTIRARATCKSWDKESIDRWTSHWLDLKMASELRTFGSTRPHRRCRPYSFRSTNTRSRRNPCRGFFEKLPAEAFDLILDYLSAVDASVLSMVPCLMMDQCPALSSCQGFIYYGVFLNTLTAGWDEHQCVFKFIYETTKLQQTIGTAVTCKPGKVGWRQVCEHILGQGDLWDLAKAIILLHGHKEAKSWRPVTILAIIDEMMVTPLPWHMENIARLLMLCGNSICYEVLASKAINGRLSEISRLLIFLILVSEKDGYCMNWAVKMTQQVCKVFPMASEKWSFIQSVENMFSETTVELYERVMAGNHNGGMDPLRHLCNLLNASAHFHTEIVYISFSKD